MDLWEGIEVSKGGTKITHLQYADDTIIFCSPRLDHLTNIKKVLILFQLVLGLQVNFHKSSLYGINMEDQWIQEATSTLLCKVGKFPLSYLGLPLGGSVSKLEAWAPIIQKIEKRMAT